MMVAIPPESGKAGDDTYSNVEGEFRGKDIAKIWPEKSGMEQYKPLPGSPRDPRVIGLGSQ